MLFFLNVIVTVYAIDKIYTISDTKKTWDNAKEECESDGGYLLTLNSQQVLNDLSNGVLGDQRLHEYLWMGLRQTDNDDECGPYTWHSGETPGTWEDWYYGEPKYCDIQKCIKMRNGKWETAYCTKRFRFICEKISNLSEAVTNSTAMSETTENGLTSSVTSNSSENQEEFTSSQSSLYPRSTFSTGKDGDSSEVVTTSTTMRDTTENGLTTSVTSDNRKTQEEFTSSLTPLYSLSSFDNCCTGKDKAELKCGSTEWTINGLHKNETLETEIKKVKEELKVLRSKTTNYIRSKISVYDSRSSSTTIGVLGTLVIIAVISLPVSLDVVKLFTFIKKCRNKKKKSCVGDASNIKYSIYQI